MNSKRADRVMEAVAALGNHRGVGMKDVARLIQAKGREPATVYGNEAALQAAALNLNSAAEAFTEALLSYLRK